ncbi:hypothetical protein ACVGVM_18800 [Pseudonocardia bannensis]|uniref:Uncharacterized protein n=1 Tax=Pseudonocardia bannensis TaxID=630973 RepID=A0A848DI82_9PSEU|nr:hypothetical protein [Pseudonocardia bannensis]NMH92253.1 hypothetical protein [Pseudonocardia bannensis]
MSRSQSESESDVADDEAVAASRDTGGRPASDDPDEGTTTGTTENDEFVGRVSGQDVGYAEETGAEARARQDDRDR